ncbi:hypothetical protein DV738_g2840, partial [Chaetothyriales sp. CBS 135597]
MFKKKPQIKNLSPLRSSDRRKLADQIIAAYHVAVPASSEQPTPDEGSSQQPTAPTLASIRVSLVPETCLSARFTTYAGANATLVSGTIFVGAHPGQEERILWIQYGQNPKPIPTVYSLWHNPGLVPLLHTPDIVVEKLKTGADLMTPGLFGGPPWPKGAQQGAVVAVAGLGRPSVPVSVGVCKIDISSLGRVQGLKGAAIEGITWYGDELWKWSQNSTGGREAPARIEGWDKIVEGLEERLHKLNGDGGVGLGAPRADTESALPEKQDGDHAEAGNGDKVDSRPVTEPTTAEVDQAFFEAFLYAIWDARKHGSAPTYGVDFPIQPSYLVSNMIQPRLRTQSASYSIKKTSWKNVKKFIKHLDKETLVKSKDRQGGETVILDIDFNDQRVHLFVPYKLPKAESAPTGQDTATANIAGNDASISQKLSLVTLYRPSGKLVPDLLPSKSSFYTASQISNALKAYIAANPSLVEGVSSKRNIKLDPFIANNILSSSSASDRSILHSSEIGRDVLQKRVLEDASLCSPYYLLLRNGEIDTFNALDDDDSTTFLQSHKPKPYPPPRIQIVVEKRSGSKTVTKISNLEAFFINPSILSPELQKKCAGSASVGQLIGGKPGLLEIMVQGDQRDVLQRELSRRGVRKESIEVTDKTKAKKGKN